MMHPITYLNKFVLWHGSTLVLYNVIEGALIHKFKLLPATVVTVVQTPVINIVACGLEDGSVLLLNLLYDEVLFTFKMMQGAVHQISFMTDANLGLSLMATSCRDSGVVTLWDLNARKIWAEMRQPHSGRQVTSVAFLPNEPVLVSASEDDNSIKMWLFEKGQSEPRLLRERSGHAEPPTKIRFYGGLDDPMNQGARHLVTCSQDGNMRDISLLNEF
jgi:U3 small nucleolar RNA-associated protein 21